MYKVYHDPEGLHSLDYCDPTDDTSRTDDFYVMFPDRNCLQRIESLNLEIKSLTQELKIVRYFFSVVRSMCSLYNACHDFYTY